MRERHSFQMSDVLTASMTLSYKIGTAVAGGAAPAIMALSGYSALNAGQPAAALGSIRMLYFTFNAAGMAIAGIIMLAVRSGINRSNASAAEIAAWGPQ